MNQSETQFLVTLDNYEKMAVQKRANEHGGGLSKEQKVNYERQREVIRKDILRLCELNGFDEVEIKKNPDWEEILATIEAIKPALVADGD